MVEGAEFPSWMTPALWAPGMEKDHAYFGFPVLNASVALEALGPALDQYLLMATDVVEAAERMCSSAPADVRDEWIATIGLDRLQDTLRAYALMFSIAAGDATSLGAPTGPPPDGGSTG